MPRLTLKERAAGAPIPVVAQSSCRTADGAAVPRGRGSSGHGSRLREATMTSATMRPARGAGDGYAERRGFGMIIFAGALLAMIGFFNLLDGISAIASAHIFIGNAHYVVGDLSAWGWVAAILGGLQLLAAAGVM